MWVSIVRTAWVLALFDSTTQVTQIRCEEAPGSRSGTTDWPGHRRTGWASTAASGRGCMTMVVAWG